MTTPMGGTEDTPDVYEAPSGIESTPPGMVSDWGNRGVAGYTLAEAMDHAMARMAELQSDTFGQGGVIGDLMPITQPYNQGRDEPGY